MTRIIMTNKTTGAKLEGEVINLTDLRASVRLDGTKMGNVFDPRDWDIETKADLPTKPGIYVRQETDLSSSILPLYWLSPSGIWWADGNTYENKWVQIEVEAVPTDLVPLVKG